MNKKEIYRKVVELLKKYRCTCIYERKHDHFIYGHIMGLIDALYISGTIDIISSCRLTDFIIYKTGKYLNGAFKYE